MPQTKKAHVMPISAIYHLCGVIAFCLPACATHSAQIMQTVPPPAALLMPCNKPVAELQTNADLARYASALLYAYELCAAKVDALRTYYTGGVDNDSK